MLLQNIWMKLLLLQKIIDLIVLRPRDTRCARQHTGSICICSCSCLKQSQHHPCAATILASPERARTFCALTCCNIYADVRRTRASPKAADTHRVGPRQRARPTQSTTREVCRCGTASPRSLSWSVCHPPMRREPLRCAWQLGHTRRTRPDARRHARHMQLGSSLSTLGTIASARVQRRVV